VNNNFRKVSIMRLIGDVHAKFDKYRSLINDVEASIQVGDFGAGFAPLPDVSTSHRFLRGNHDDLRICENSKNWIPDGTCENGIFYIGGAYSVDQHLRTIGKDWWPDEELSYQRMQELIDVYESYRPDIVISHDAPIEYTTYRFNPSSQWTSRTNQALQTMFDISKPRLWIHGHWHKSARTTIFGCEFISLAELESIEINL
jgi:Icc-related predicted phosphoesterase